MNNLMNMGTLPNGGSYTIQVNNSDADTTYLLVQRSAWNALHEENEQLRTRVAELEAQLQSKQE